ncbi:MAG: F0F1 ATP synthase subunit B [Gemmatimonadetes bacterium]|nr:F0F1 ATP synthase subunit B [Gemmatimonadota bacterium]
MNLLWLVVKEAQAEGGGSIFAINPGVSFWSLVIFLALLVVLTRYAWRPMLGALEARERRIQEILDAAARDRAEAERVLEGHRRQLAEARQQAHEILAEAKQATERVRDDILKRARAEQEQMLARARQEISRERERALEAIREEAVELSLAAASRLIERRLESAEDRKLVREYLEQVGRSREQEFPE